MYLVHIYVYTNISVPLQEIISNLPLNKEHQLHPPNHISNQQANNHHKHHTHNTILNLK